MTPRSLYRTLVSAAAYATCIGLITAFAGPAHGNGLMQVNPSKKAPPQINDKGPQAPQESPYVADHNEYPMFTRDGKLFLWTHQENPNPGTQWIWVAYLKNRDWVAATPANQQMRPLDVSTPMDLHPVNHWFIDNTTDPNFEIKALALCEESAQPVALTNPARHRYQFTLFLAVGPGGSPREMVRFFRVFVVVRDSDHEIMAMGHAPKYPGGDPGLPDVRPVIPYDTHPITGEQANETEPMITRAGDYLFWASNAWGGQHHIAHTIGPTSACAQLEQNPVPYTSLPTSRFAWKDQYDDQGSATKEKNTTSRTNYHAILERKSGGATALIFEECHGKVACSNGGTRDCDCEAQNDQFSTTGFAAGGAPTPLEAYSSTDPIITTRVTHPAISGEQRPADGTWLLFYMRNREIFYTKIKEK